MPPQQRREVWRLCSCTFRLRQARRAKRVRSRLYGKCNRRFARWGTAGFQTAVQVGALLTVSRRGGTDKGCQDIDALMNNCAMLYFADERQHFAMARSNFHKSVQDVYIIVPWSRGR